MIQWTSDEGLITIAMKNKSKIPYRYKNKLNQLLKITHNDHSLAYDDLITYEMLRTDMCKHGTRNG